MNDFHPNLVSSRNLRSNANHTQHDVDDPVRTEDRRRHKVLDEIKKEGYATEEQHTDIISWGHKPTEMRRNVLDRMVEFDQTIRETINQFWEAYAHYALTHLEQRAYGDWADGSLERRYYGTLMGNKASLAYLDQDRLDQIKVKREALRNGQKAQPINTGLSYTRRLSADRLKKKNDKSVRDQALRAATKGPSNDLCLGYGKGKKKK